MRVLAVSLRDFRCYERRRGRARRRADGRHRAATAPARRTCSRRSTSAAPAARAGRTNEREVVRFGAGAARVVVLTLRGDDGLHELSVGFEPGQPKRMRVDGATVERLLDVEQPAAGQRVPARPARADQGRARAAPRPPRPVRLGAVAGPGRDPPRLRAGAGAAQRADRADPLRPRLARSLQSWDAQLARHGIALMSDRAQRGRADRRSRSRGSPAISGWTATRRLLPAALARHRPRRAGRRARRAARRRPRARLHRPRPAPRRAVATEHDGHDLRAYGSQGQQRLALLALLLAEREAIADAPRRVRRDAARRRDERARPRPPPGARRAAARDRRPVGDHRRPTSSTCPARPIHDVTHLAVADGRFARRRPT